MLRTLLGSDAVPATAIVAPEYGPERFAPVAGDVIATDGPAVSGGAVRLTVTPIDCSEMLPALSVARAVIVWLPMGRLTFPVQVDKSSVAFGLAEA